MTERRGERTKDDGERMDDGGVTYRPFREGEDELERVVELIREELSEPYSIFTYRYFVGQWPQACYFACVDGKEVGVIVCKMDAHRIYKRGYIAMLVVQKKQRHLGLGTGLVQSAIQVMRREKCEEVALEAEVTNDGALRLYEKLGFIRDKRLHRYYLHGADAFRLKLLLPEIVPSKHVDENGMETTRDEGTKTDERGDAVADALSALDKLRVHA